MPPRLRCYARILTACIVFDGEIVLVQLVEIEGSKERVWRREQTGASDKDREIGTHVLSCISIKATSPGCDGHTMPAARPVRRVGRVMLRPS